MNISIIIPNFNGEALLQKNLPIVLDAVKKYSYNVEIIIPDDMSSDNSRDVIQEFISNTNSKNIFCKSVDNLAENEKGFSKNVNRGVKLATGEILILLNTDVAPHKDFLDPLLRPFSDSKVFAVGCMDESHEGKRVILRGRGLADFKRGFLVHRAGSVEKYDTMWVSGGSGAFRKSIWDKLGGLDTVYNPFYWEDIDLSYRAIKSGYKVQFEPNSVVVHEHEKGIIKNKFNQKYINSISYRNQFIFVWKNITAPALIASHFFWLPYHFLKAAVEVNAQFFIGFFMAIGNLGMIMKARADAKKTFIKNDQEIIKAYAYSD